MLGGKDARLPRKREYVFDAASADPKKKSHVYRRHHTCSVVHRSMLWQICRDYPSLSDPRTLTVTEIVFWYEGLRAELYERTKPRKK